MWSIYRECTSRLMSIGFNSYENTDQVCCHGNNYGVMWQLWCTSHFNARLPLSVSSSIAMATNSTVSQRWEAARRFKDSHPKKRKLCSPSTSLKGPFMWITLTVMVQRNRFLFFFFYAWYWWHVFSFQPSSAVAHCNPHTSIYKLNCNSARPKMHCHNARLWMQMHTCADHV